MSLRSRFRPAGPSRSPPDPSDSAPFGGGGAPAAALAVAFPEALLEAFFDLRAGVRSFASVAGAEPPAIGSLAAPRLSSLASRAFSRLEPARTEASSCMTCSASVAILAVDTLPNLLSSSSGRRPAQPECARLRIALFWGAPGASRGTTRKWPVAEQPGPGTPPLWKVGRTASLPSGGGKGKGRRA